MRRFRSPGIMFVVGLLLLTSFGASLPPAQAQTVLTVNTTEDLDKTIPGTDCEEGDNKCTLRRAIRAANAIAAGGGSAVIEFNLQQEAPGQITWRFTLRGDLGPLPPIGTLGAAAPVVLDGSSQERNFNGDLNRDGPEIIIDGTNITAEGGIRLFGNGATVKNLGITNFKGGIAGIRIQGDGNSVLGNYIGVNEDGTAAQPNAGPGILILSGIGNIIGGSNQDEIERNIISGNDSDGIRILGGSGTLIRGNYIGLDRTGVSPIPNDRHGIYIDGSATSSHTIGSSGDASDRIFSNTISGNGGWGIYINGSRENNIYGNVIGLDKFLFSPVPNGTSPSFPNAGGVLIASNAIPDVIGNEIGGTGAAAGNLIAGHTGPGIQILGEEVSQTTIINNVIGLNRNYAIPGGTPTQTVGILINDGADENTIGGPDNARNVIAGNNGDGIRISGTFIQGTVNRQANNNQIFNNCIGVAPPAVGSPTSCTVDIPNLGDGIDINTNAFATQIGGSEANLANLIENNAGDGIKIRGERIEDTSIGINTIAGNGGSGISIGGTNVANTTISRTTVIDNGGDGINISGDGAIGDLYVRNTSIQGENQQVLAQIEGNFGHGIAVTNALDLSIRYVSTSFNAGTGILFNDQVMTSTLLSSTSFFNAGNGVSIDRSDNGTLALLRLQQNLGYGLVISETVNMLLNDSLVYSNTLDGVRLFNANRTGVVSNTIVGNLQNGVSVDSDGVPVSRRTNIVRNTIVENGASATAPAGGVLITRTGEGRFVEQVRVTENTISRNLPRGIEIDPATNGPPGVQANPNHDIDPPVFEPGNPLALRVNGAGLLSGFVLTPTVPLTPTFPPDPNPNIVPAAACTRPCLVEVFATDPELETPDGQGHTLLGQVFVNVNGFFQLELPNVPPLPPQILVTATDGYGNTSEYGEFISSLGLAIGPPRTVTVAPGDVVTFTHRVTNTGTVDITDLALSAESRLDWPITSVQLSATTLEAQQSTPVTVTVQVPEGPAPNVLAGLVDELTVTASSALGDVSASVVNLSTVSERFVLTATPLVRSGSGAPSESPDDPTVIDYVHTLRNIGNITGTVTLVADTDLGDPPWTTLVSPRTVTLGPGESADVNVRVTIPFGAQGGTVAVTETQISGPDNTLITLTDTTTVVVEARANLFPAQSADAAAGQTVSFCHTVTNLSNGTQSFQINGGSSLGSRISFRSNTPNQELGANNIFTVSTAQGLNSFQFCADITVAARALPGQTDSITIFLTTPPAQGSEVVGGASVINTIRVVQGEVFPRLWLPIVRLNS